MGECNLMPDMSMYAAYATIDSATYRINLKILDRVLEYYKGQHATSEMIEYKFKEFKKLVYGV